MVLRVCRIGLPHRGPGPELAPTVFAEAPSRYCKTAFDSSSRTGHLLLVWMYPEKLDRRRLQSKRMEMPIVHRRAPTRGRAPVPVKCMSKGNTLVRHLQRRSPPDPPLLLLTEALMPQFACRLSMAWYRLVLLLLLRLLRLLQPTAKAAAGDKGICPGAGWPSGD